MTPEDIRRPTIPYPTRTETAARTAGGWHEPGKLWAAKKPLPDDRWAVVVLTSFALGLIFIAVASLIAGIWQ